MSKPRPRNEPPPPISDGVARAVEALGSSPFLPRSGLLALGIARAGIDEALALLRKRGFEVSRKGARVPVAAQLRARLAESPLLPLRSIEAFVEGASRREAVAAANALVAAGEAAIIVRSTEVFLGSITTDTLAPRDIERLRAALASLTRATALATRKGGKLLRADVAEALRGFASTETKPRTADEAPKRGAGFAIDADIAQALASNRGSSGLVFIPHLVRALGGARGRARVHSALREGAAHGRLELRPESGMGRLSAEEKTDCLEGPEGSLLSWVREVEVRP